MTYSLKTKDEERQMEDHIVENIKSIKQCLEELVVFIPLCEEFFINEEKYLNSTKSLFEGLQKFTNSNMNDLNEGMGCVSDIMNVIYSGKVIANIHLKKTIIPTLKKFLNENTIRLRNFIIDYNEEKELNNDFLLKTTEVAKSLEGKQESLNLTLLAINKLEVDMQSIIYKAFNTSTLMLREMYCGMVKLFNERFSFEKGASKSTEDVLNSNEEYINAIAEGTTIADGSLVDLLHVKKQVLIDLKNMDPAVKKALRTVGIKKRDLKKPAVVELIKNSVQQAVIDGKIDQQVLDQFAPPPPPSPPSPPPPPPSMETKKQTDIVHNNDNDIQNTNEIKQNDDKNHSMSFLSDVQNGVKLKKNTYHKPIISEKQELDLVDYMKRNMELRRKDISPEEYESDDSDSEWSV